MRKHAGSVNSLGSVDLDVDPRSGGELALGRLEARWGALPATVESRTGGGGRHLWFAVSETLPSAVLTPGLELKAERGMAIAPPSLHVSGERYAWSPGRDPDEAALAAVPAWLAALAHGDPQARARHPLAEPPVRTPVERRAFAEAWSRAGVTLEPGDHYYLCPFHPDSHPSLHVDAEGCRWFCFGCRRGGGLARLRRLLGEVAPPTERGRLTGTVGEPRPLTLEGADEVQVVGEADHQDVLLALSGGRRRYGGVDLTAVAELRPDDGSAIASPAVAVLVDGRHVGDLAVDDARRLLPAIEAARHAHGAATCRARIRGGWDRGGDAVGRFGVVLLLPGV